MTVRDVLDILNDRVVVRIWVLTDGLNRSIEGNPSHVATSAPDILNSRIATMNVKHYEFDIHYLTIVVDEEGDI